LACYLGCNCYENIILDAQVILDEKTDFAFTFFIAISNIFKCPRFNHITRFFLSTPPTFRSLAFRWIIEGDENLNSTVLVQYRKKDTMDWKFAMPLTRIDGDVVDREYGPFKTGNLFSGSILELEPATLYEVQLRLSESGRTYEEKQSKSAHVPRMRISSQRRCCNCIRKITPEK